MEIGICVFHAPFERVYVEGECVLCLRKQIKAVAAKMGELDKALIEAKIKICDELEKAVMADEQYSWDSVRIIRFLDETVKRLRA